MPFFMAGDPDLEVDAGIVAGRGRGRRRSDRARRAVLRSDRGRPGRSARRGACARQRGTSLRQILGLVAELRAGGLDTPIILFGYYNPVFHYGPARLAADAARAGVDGLLVVDLPPEEADELWRPARAAGLDVIFLLAPTSDAERVRAVLRKASGFVYFVSMTGITGTKAIDAVRRPPHGRGPARRAVRLPIGVGFGITTPAEAARGGGVCRRRRGRQRHRAHDRGTGDVAGPGRPKSARSFAR